VGARPTRMLINTQKRPESQSGILVIVEPGFPFARFGEDLFALRNRERGFFQMLKGECGGANPGICVKPRHTKLGNCGLID
jgi:hypothetical protein